MDENRCADMTRLLTSMPSRRHLLRGLAGAGLGLGVARLPQTAAAKNKRKPKKPQPNEYGCLEVGDPCQNARQCCSSLCQGKKGKKRCRAHDTGTCSTGGQPGTCGGTDVACITSRDEEGVCATTTGNAGYCMSVRTCFACKSDAYCQIADGGVLGPRAACIRCANCTETGGAACAIPDEPQTM